MSRTFKDVPPQHLLEFPVAENMQLGYCTGRSLAGALPVCCYPRINFLLEATSQLVQHLDKIPVYSGWSPKVLIRTAIATPTPLNPGVQHLGDYSHIFEQMLNMRVVRLREAWQIVPEYQAAAERSRSTLLVEYTELYDA